MKKILVIAPHQDDETLGAGCSIYEHHLEGDEVSVAFLTDGSFLQFGNTATWAQGAVRPAWDKFTEWYVELRELEALRALALLGVDEQRVTFFRLPDTRLSYFVRECSL